MTRTLTVVTSVLLVVLVVGVAWEIHRRGWFSVVLPALLLAWGLVRRARPPTVIEASAIRRPWQRPSLATPPPPRPRPATHGPRTDQEIEADVARRARALAEERTVLEAQNRKRPSGPRSDPG